jgi:hypothetical protein
MRVYSAIRTTWLLTFAMAGLLLLNTPAFTGHTTVLVSFPTHGSSPSKAAFRQPVTQRSTFGHELFHGNGDASIRFELFSLSMCLSFLRSIVPQNKFQTEGQKDSLRLWFWYAVLLARLVKFSRCPPITVYNVSCMRSLSRTKNDNSTDHIPSLRS